MNDGIVHLMPPSSFQYEPWLAFPEVDSLRGYLAEGAQVTMSRLARSKTAERSVRNNAYDNARGAWQVLCPIEASHTVLDVGCGLGALSRSLARNCANVLALDPCRERLMVNGRINQEAGLANIRLLLGGHKELSRLPDSSVDGVVLNGVLEWTPSDSSGDPLAIQRACLSECRRILRPTGWIYIGIENRWGFRYFLGGAEDHVGVRFVSLLPRWLANLYLRCLGKGSYRTHTHSPCRYVEMVRAAGFDSATVYGALPSYRHLKAIVPLDKSCKGIEPAELLGIHKPWKRRFINKASFLQRFVPSVSIVGTCSSPNLFQWPAWLEEVGGNRLAIDHLRVKHDQAMIWYHAKNGLRIREVALTPEAAAKQRNASALAGALCCESAAQPFFADWNLRCLDRWSFVDRAALPGSELYTFQNAQGVEWAARVCTLLDRLYSCSVDRNLVAQSLSTTFADYAGRGLDDLEVGLRHRVQGLLHDVDSAISGRTMIMHGDCRPRNILVSGTALALIDWEWARFVTYPGFDVLNYAWRSTRSPDSPSFVWREDSIEACISDAGTRTLFEALHPGQPWPECVVAYWLLRLARGLRSSNQSQLPQVWVETACIPALMQLLSLTESFSKSRSHSGR